MNSIRPIYCEPHHPQTTDKIERFHETLKARMNLLVYTSPDELRRTMQEFIDYYNHCRYHDAIGNVTPADVFYGRREEILHRREEQKQRTIQERLRYNLGRSNLKLSKNVGDVKSVFERTNPCTYRRDGWVGDLLHTMRMSNVSYISIACLLLCVNSGRDLEARYSALPVRGIDDRSVDSEWQSIIHIAIVCSDKKV